MASSDGLRIVVRGRQTHGAMPWGGIDPIVVSSQIILGLQTIASRQLPVTLTPSIITMVRAARARWCRGSPARPYPGPWLITACTLRAFRRSPDKSPYSPHMLGYDDGFSLLVAFFRTR